MMKGNVLEIRDLHVEFGPKDRAIQVLNGVSFDIPQGGAVGLVGESGSGKSVTSLATMRLIPSPPGRVTKGTITFNGTDLLALPLGKMPDIRGRDIAMIFQEPMSSLNPVMKIGDQIGEAIMLHENIDRRARRAKVIEMLKLVGIPNPEGRLDSYPHQFSGGMRQRVMIAMALLCRPKLLIADEPTTALDVTIQAQVLELMKDIRARLGTAILLISHDLGVVADLCDSVVVMYAGHVVEIGATEEIFDTPRHPYTRGLLASIPRLHGGEERLFQIPGSVPVPGTIKKGCPFYSRCGMRIDRCRTEMPPMFDFDGSQRAACWVTAAEAHAHVKEPAQ